MLRNRIGNLAINADFWGTFTTKNNGYGSWPVSLLSGNTFIETINLTGLDTAQLTEMNFYVAGCDNLIEIDISGWDLSNINMKGYSYDYWYAQLYLNIWTSNGNHDKLRVITNNWLLPKQYINMNNIINNYKDYYVEANNWKFQHNSMLGLFKNFNYFNYLSGFETWDVSNVINMSSLFVNCTGIIKIDLTNWNISKVKTMEQMFYGCSSLKEVRMGGNPSALSSLSINSDEYYGYEPSDDSWDITLSATNSMFGNITTTGNFYYNSAYNYSKILTQLPSTWTAIPCTLKNGVLVPN